MYYFIYVTVSKGHFGKEVGPTLRGQIWGSNFISQQFLACYSDSQKRRTSKAFYFKLEKLLLDFDLVRLKAHPHVPNAKLSNLKIFRTRTYQDWSRKIRMYGNPKAELTIFPSIIHNQTIRLVRKLPVTEVSVKKG